MKKIHAHGKCFDSKDFENLVIGGQNDADTIRFVVPRIFAGEVDYSEWEWAIHYENKEGQGDTVALTSQQSSDNADNIWIDWTPSQTATQVSGKLLCQLYSIRTVGEETRRFSFHTFSIYVDAWLNPIPITQALPSVMEQALEQMEKYNQDLQDAITSGKNAAVSEKNAAASAKAAALSETAAKTSETNAKTSESNSKTSETNAKKSEEAARASEESATAAASAAKTSETNAKISETNAAASKEEAANSASNASKSETNAKASEDAAKTSETNAKTSEDNAKKSAERAEELAETFDSEQIKESINEIVSAFQLAKARGWHEPGEIFQWSSKKKRPERTLVCNGAGLSKTDPLFADLYAAIGTDFGENDDGTMFLLPDYIKCYNADGTVNPNVKGLFPRPTDNVDEIGVKEQDTIRNIRGLFGHTERGTFNNAAWAFYQFDTVTGWTTAGQNTTGTVISQIGFSANSGVSENSPMAGHAVGPDIKPYLIKALYLIAY